jgi:2-polyprenyl-6-methoxyphenol hydroxylase-like FAD-dependent oxidoreductase
MQTEGGTGHPGFISHKQPAIEKHLRERIHGLKRSELRVGCVVTSVREDENWVYATYTDEAKQERCIRSRFLVGADGKTGLTRKHYLEPKGVLMEKVAQKLYEETWVALNWKISLPTEETHPHFPLWSMGYTPQQVYDSFFPSDFRFLCNPKRAAVCGRFGLADDRLWRFEFVVLPGEQGNDMASPENIHKVVYPYITHPGSKYGLAVAGVQFPSDCIEVLRCRPFRFSARSCNVWAKGRVVLCGDAAHVFPPFGGQGIASGFRDAISLAWRLVIATRQASPADNVPAYHKLLEGWYSERKQQLDKSLASTIENGDYVTQTDPLKIFVRDWYLWAIQLVPDWKHWLELGNRREGMVKYEWQDGKGMAFLPQLGGGGNFPQVYCRKLGDTEDCGAVQFTDDVIFASGMQGLFQLVVFLTAMEDVPRVRRMISGLDEESGGLLRTNEAAFILKSTTPTLHNAMQCDETVYRLATGEEFGLTDLCNGRPKPQFYNPLRISDAVESKRLIILRPDRFVFAACNHRKELLVAASALKLLTTEQLGT